MRLRSAPVGCIVPGSRPCCPCRQFYVNCALRIRAHSNQSTLLAPIVPSADRQSDKVTVIAVEIYWMGEDDHKWTYVFDDDSESRLLSKFEHVIKSECEVDCFEYVFDNCEPFQYLAMRKPNLKLSKFLTVGSKLIRRKNSIQVCNVLHHGRSRINLQHVHGYASSL